MLNSAVIPSFHTSLYTLCPISITVANIKYISTILIFYIYLVFSPLVCDLMLVLSPLPLPLIIPYLLTLLSLTYIASPLSFLYSFPPYTLLPSPPVPFVDIVDILPLLILVILITLLAHIVSYSSLHSSRLSSLLRIRIILLSPYHHQC